MGDARPVDKMLVVQQQKLRSVPATSISVHPVGPNNSPNAFHGTILASVTMPSLGGKSGSGSIIARSPQSTLSTSVSTGQAPTSIQKPTAKKDAETLYMDKLASMQQYIEPLYTIINMLETDGRKVSELDRLRKLYQILTNTRKVNMDFLEKCENALKKMEQDQMFIKITAMAQKHTMALNHSFASIPSVPKQLPAAERTDTGTGAVDNDASGGTTSTSSTTTVPEEVQSDICQPLIDAIMKNRDRPMFSHTLARTFAPALAILHPEPIHMANLTFSNTQPTELKRKRPMD